MKGPAPAALLAVLAAAAALAAPVAQASGPEVTLLLHHPNDGVDPFGFPYAGDDAYFMLRYAPLVADKQRFDYPFFVADGVHAIEGPVNASRPFAAARDAYSAAVDDRLGEESPATLRLATTMAGPSAVLGVAVEPVAPLAGAHVHLFVALAEDPVHFLPPPGLTNGVEDHRFTLRAVADLGELDLAGASNATHTFTLSDSWARDRLVAAAWLQAESPGTRFAAREVVQATHVVLGGSVVQDSKGVLVEMLSATWCEPCLYGDLAAEAVAVEHGSAEPLDAGAGPRYFQPPASPVLAVLAALLAGVAAAWWGGKR